MDINQILANVILGAITVAVPSLSALLGHLIVLAIKNSKNQQDDRLAALAVAWAEDKFGNGDGLKKLDSALHVS